MKNLILPLSLFLFSTTTLTAQYNSDNLVVKQELAFERFSVEKLRIYPITANRVFLEAHKNVGNYKPLKNGLSDGTVKILERGAAANSEIPVSEAQPLGRVMENAEDANPQANVAVNNLNDSHVQHRRHVQANLNRDEVRHEEPVLDEVVQTQQTNIRTVNGGGGSDQVNTLYIQNNGKDTVFIMAGEVVKGGKQDRVIAMDMIIPPNSQPIDLSVFCVEHGRWTYGGNEAADGFTGHANVANTSVRKAAIVQKDQSAVWGKVEEVTVANKATSSTGTLNALEKNVDYQKELSAYERKFADLPASAPSIIGVVAVTGNRIIGCDMFATPDLFRNAFPDLLKSYASEAITSGEQVRISNETVNKYITDILDESQQRARVSEKGQMFEQSGTKMHISTFD